MHTSSPDPKKVWSICQHTTTYNSLLSEVRSLLGMANYSSKFVKDYATITEPLLELTRKSTCFTWTQKHQAAYDKLKHALLNSPVMSHFYTSNETSNGQVEFPSDICFFSWSITMYLNDVMTSPWTSWWYCAIEIAKRKCPLDPVDPMDLEMSTGILFVHWMQWTSGISIADLLFHLVN
jgi:hypothetical protein